MSLGRCKKCGANMDLVGTRHNCNPPKSPESEAITRRMAVLGEDQPKALKPIKAGYRCECPCCTLRREKALAAVKRFREKSKKRVPSHGDKTGP